MSTAEVEPTALPQSDEPPRARRWTRDEYYQLGELGLFRNQRVQLIEGEIVVTSPMGTRHATAMRLTNKTLSLVIQSPLELLCQLPLTFTDESEPEPDFAIVQGNPCDGLTGHPKTALLVVEVSDSTLKFDQSTKRELYARNHVPEYWIINLKDGQVEVHCHSNGSDYQNVTTHKTGETIGIEALPHIQVAVADFLP